MGYQQSLLKLKSKEDLIKELKAYLKRDTINDDAYLLGVNKTLKSIDPFTKGELSLVVGGERYSQRNKMRVKEGLGINNVQQVVFIDNPDYWFMSNGNLGGFLDEHFQPLTKEEVDELLE